MSRRPLYIQMRDGTYYFRYRVPAKLRAIIGRTEYHYSLKTSDYREAKRLIPIPADHHWCAHSRKPIDMMVQG
ncbi:DUF6538 domain-containing protein [Microvirga sp. M2]|uniref:DUF6538 domain-containing protein n=1 Tax=Microvirga sp. M2 TaxID=3073270 RepID=UPI0039C28DD2